MPLFSLLHHEVNSDIVMGMHCNSRRTNLIVLAPIEYYQGSNSKKMVTGEMEAFLAKDLAKFKDEIKSGIDFSFSFEELNHKIFKSDNNQTVGNGLRKLFKENPEEFKKIIFSKRKHIV